MKTIDLGEKSDVTSERPVSPKKWYPTISFSDNGVAGVSSFDDQDIGKVINITAEIKLTGIDSRSDNPKKKKFDYTFEVHKIHMPDDLSKQEDTLKERQKERAKKMGFE
jgi:hypothetical protein